MTKKYVKLFTLLFAICTLCFAALGVAACNKKEQGHEHTYGEWQITKPTETEVGSAVKTCLTCKENKEGHTVTVTLPVLGNEGYAKTADTASCEVGGEIVYTISINSEPISFAIETSAKGHSFNKDFWFGDGFTHWHSPACEHDVKGDEAPCYDENGDSNCDVCGYPIHEHSYGWNGNANEHWLEPTCSDTTEIKEKEPHIDSNNDDICDKCGRLLLHTHKYSEAWSFDENAHWHAPICTDTTVGADEAVHKFKNGVCECGAVENETNAYKILNENADLQEGYVEWLNSIKEDGVTNVTVTVAGDVIYNYGNGTTETIYVAERTVKVMATTSSGDEVAHVWFMISLYTDKSYKEIGGTTALDIAETDEDGIAVLSFLPVSGYSGENVEYRIRLAEAKDIAISQGTKEEDARPIPNRYTATGRSDDFITVEVDENAISDNVIGQFGFAFSKGWNAYEQFILPYARYFEDPMDEESEIKEANANFEFIISGGDLFDYFYFIPSNKYSFASADSTYTPDQLAVIEQNFALAASGIYKIYFTVEGNANVTLYYWNEGGVNLGAYHVTNSDGTPSDDYITSISGGTAGEGKYTGGNYVDVTVTHANGLRNYQFGIISDRAVNIIFTVERTGDYVIGENAPITVGDNNNITLIGNGAITALELQDVPAGYYYLTINTTDDVEKLSGLFSAYVDPSCVTSLWDGISQFNGIIEIPTGTPFLYICNYYSAEDDEFLTVSVNLSVYEPPVVKIGEEISVPISGMGLDSGIEISLDESVTSGKYYFELTFAGGQALSGSIWYVRVLVGDNDYSFSLPTSTSSSEKISAYIDINKGDTLSIFILNKNSGVKYISAIVSGKLKLTESGWVDVQLDTVVNANFDTDAAGTLYDEKYFTFTAPKSSTYKLSLTLLNEPNMLGNIVLDLYYLQVENNSTQEIIVNRGENSTTTGIHNTQASGTFELEEGETIILKFHRLVPLALLNIDFKIECVNE